MRTTLKVSFLSYEMKSLENGAIFLDAWFHESEVLPMYESRLVRFLRVAKI